MAMFTYTYSFDNDNSVIIFPIKCQDNVQKILYFPTPTKPRMKFTFVIFRSLHKTDDYHQLSIINSKITTGWANKKRGALLLSISLPIIDRFSEFFHWHTLQTICNNVIIIYPIIPLYIART